MGRHPGAVGPRVALDANELLALRRFRHGDTSPSFRPDARRLRRSIAQAPTGAKDLTEPSPAGTEWGRSALERAEPSLHPRADALEKAAEIVPTMARGDLRLYYAERGNPDGPPVVLLHGLTMSSRTMERLAASLPEYRVVLLDFHGHGKSSKPRSFHRYLVAEFADDVVALLDHLGMNDVILVGLSLGANVAYEVALRNPERIGALVLAMPVFSRGQGAGRVFFAALAGLFAGLYPALTPWHPVIRRFPLPRRAYELAFLRDLVVADHLAQAALMWSISRQDAPRKDADTLSQLTMPVLVTAHSYDPIHSVDDASELVADLSDARRIDLRSIVDFVIRNAEINCEVGGFLRGLPASPRIPDGPSSGAA
jgi:pimeloyl-ACP methyl ester carboxylesterase